MEGGAYSGRFNSTDGHIKASNFIELLEFLNDRVDNFPLEQFWELIDSVSLEERKEKIRKQQKRVKKRFEKFNPINIKRPKNPMNLYRIEYKNRIMTDGKEYNQEEFNKSWNELSEADKQVYVDQYNKNMEQYEIDYNKDMELAILEGEYEAAEPKKPLSIYMLFMDFCRRENNTIVSDEMKTKLSELSLIETTKKLCDLYKEFITDETNLKKLEDAKDQYTQLYSYNYYHWKIINLEGRIKKCKREGKNSTYLETELEEYKKSVDFDTDTEPTININWIYESKTKTQTKTTINNSTNINNSINNNELYPISSSKSKVKVKSKATIKTK